MDSTRTPMIDKGWLDSGCTTPLIGRLGRNAVRWPVQYSFGEIRRGAPLFVGDAFTVKRGLTMMT